MPATRTARERARAELTQVIKDEARRQLTQVAPGELSMRAVARELEMVSSAVYRYFPSKDDLLTALIIDAYDALGERAESAASSAAGSDPVAHWSAVCGAVRGWAREHSHEYALIYGSPVPGYRAPRQTVVAAGRVPLALIGVVRDAWAAGALDEKAPGQLAPDLDDQLVALAATIESDLPPAVLARCMVAWTQLFGMVSFELFGHLVGGADPADPFFAYAVGRMAAFVGLRPRDDRRESVERV